MLNALSHLILNKFTFFFKKENEGSELKIFAKDRLGCLKSNQGLYDSKIHTSETLPSITSYKEVALFSGSLMQHSQNKIHACYVPSS